jgi:hypothetical protein
VILDIVQTLASSLLFLFIFWERLKEDYTQNQIFTTGFYVLFGIGCGNIIADNFWVDWWFWSGLVGGVIGLLLGIRRFRLRIFESLEAFVISCLSLFFVITSTNLIFEYSKESLFLVSGLAVFIIIFLMLDKHYKKFTWYKSGRVGFSGLTVLGLFFLTRSIVAMSGLSVLSFAGELEVVVSGVLSFASFLAVYNLSSKV